MWKRALFIFRRDLRIEDNTGLISALKYSQYVIPCFILDPLLVETIYIQNKIQMEKSLDKFLAVQ